MAYDPETRKETIEDDVPKSPEAIARELALKHCLLKSTLNGWAIMREAEAAILEALRIQREQAWIPVSERLPEDKQMVIAWGGPEMENPIVLRYIGGRQFHDFFKNWVAVTHWMPLPQPPETKP